MNYYSNRGALRLEKVFFKPKTYSELKRIARRERRRDQWNWGGVPAVSVSTTTELHQADMAQSVSEYWEQRIKEEMA